MRCWPERTVRAWALALFVAGAASGAEPAAPRLFHVRAGEPLAVRVGAGARVADLPTGVFKAAGAPCLEGVLARPGDHSFVLDGTSCVLRAAAPAAARAAPTGCLWRTTAREAPAVAEHLCALGLADRGWNRLLVSGCATAREARTLEARLAARGLVVIPVEAGDVRASPSTSETVRRALTEAALAGDPLVGAGDPAALPRAVRALYANGDVIALARDAQGLGARSVPATGGRAQVRPLADGTFALALVSTNGVASPVFVDLEALGAEGYWLARDLWRQRDEGQYARIYGVVLEPGACHLVRFLPRVGARFAPGVADVREAAWFRRARFPDEAAPCEHCRSRARDGFP